MSSRKLTGLFALSSSTLLLAAAAAPRTARKSPAQRAAWTLSNGVLSATLPAGARDLSALEITSLADNIGLQLGEPFILQLQNGQSLASSQMQRPKPLSLSRIAAHPGSARHAATLAGSQLCADFALPSDAGGAHWCLISRDGTNYLRQELTLHAGATKLAIAKVVLFRFHAPEAKTVGAVAGSPIVDANFFLGFEDPLATNTVTGGNIECTLHRTLPLEPGQTIAYSAVIGWSHPGQMRRDFLRYIEQERAHPYRTFLHYNTWYDIGYGERYNQAEALDRIHAFGNELLRKRHVVMDSFLFDDGWDNTSSLWKMDSGFPNGFTPVREAARKYGFGIGVWLSPWGGYSREKQERIAFGTKAGYEIVKGGYALSGPRVRQRFRDRHSPHRPSPPGEARHLHQPHHGNVALSVLAALRRLHLERRRRPQLRRRRHRSPTLDHLSRRPNVSGNCPERPALSAKLSHAARHPLCKTGPQSRHGSRQRLRRRSA